MAISKWNVGLSGKWSAAANWSGGIPFASTDVTIDRVGSYAVTLSTNGFANSLTFTAPTGIFSETAAGTLNITHGLNITDGAMILRNANFIGDGVIQQGGLLEISNSGALGTNTYTFLGG